MNSYQEELTQDAIERSQDLIRRNNERRERAKEVLEAEKHQSRLQDWSRLQQNIRTTKHELAKMKPVFEKLQRELEELQRGYDEYIAEGFVPFSDNSKPVGPVIAKIPVVVDLVPKQAAVVEPYVPITMCTEPCPNCGEPYKVGTAYHQRTLDGEPCIVDAVRAKSSGRFSPDRLEQLVDLSNTLKQNLNK